MVHMVWVAIKKALATWLTLAKKRGAICDFVKGEQWLSSSVADKIKRLCPDVLGDAELYYPNSGITIILL